MSTESDLQEAIENCSRDPIHIPGAIQSYGALIATDGKLGRIEFASLNTLDHLGIPAADLIGAPINAILNEELAHEARNVLGHRTIEQQREVIGEYEVAGKRRQISVHRKDKRAILEFMPIPAGGSGESNALEKTRALLAETACQPDMQRLLESSVECLNAQTGYDRVKAYRFLPDGSGEVVAEARSSDTIESFLGLRFPATDIPPVARRLYVETPIRIISDIEGTETAVLGLDADARPLDMSLAVLRGTANIHIRYLQNMGVRSTMTLPIIIEGRLWGLFSLHHMTPRVPDPTMLIGAELSGTMLSVVIQHATQLRHHNHLGICAAIADDLIVADRKLSVGDYWRNRRDHLTEILPSDGIAYIVGDQVETFGDAPGEAACLAVRDLSLTDDRNVASYDDLPDRLPDLDLGDAAGALVIPLSANPQTSLVLFRNLVLRTINWAGAPEKEVVKGDRGFELNPRNSFEKYAETARKMSDEWSHEDIEVATVLWKLLSQNFAAREIKEGKRRLDILVSELNHRVRNILALVQSLSSKAFDSATSLEGYATALEERIVALAGAHDLLTRADMRGVRLDRLAAIELKPYLDSKREAAVLSGPEVVLSADVSPIFALLLHELTSNAVKYGAFSVPTGKVMLTWDVTSAGLVINWVEKGGPPVVEPTREGFGRSIIESAIPYEFGGKAEIAFDPGGVRASFLLPTGEFEAEASRITDQKTSEPMLTRDVKTAYHSRSCLIVEDNFVIAKEMQRRFKTLGFQEAAAVSNINNALKILDEKTFDFCLLDVNLRGEVSAPVAEKLRSIGTPFIFASGYGSEGQTMCNNFEAPFLTKPVQFEELRVTLSEMGLEAG